MGQPISRVLEYQPYADGMLQMEAPCTTDSEASWRARARMVESELYRDDLEG